MKNDSDYSPPLFHIRQFSMPHGFCMPMNQARPTFLITFFHIYFSVKNEILMPDLAPSLLDHGHPLSAPLPLVGTKTAPPPLPVGSSLVGLGGSGGPTSDEGDERLTVVEGTEEVSQVLAVCFQYRLFFWTFFGNDLQLRVGETLSFSKNSLSLSQNFLSFCKNSLSFSENSLNLSKNVRYYSKYPEFKHC